ncbi:MAG: ABC transporter permease subunit [Planctomycetota bacterium]
MDDLSDQQMQALAGRPERPRVRKTSPMVRVKDRAAAGIIRGGGLLVLAAMLGICVFLFQSAAPLLLPGTVEGTAVLATDVGEPKLLLNRDGVVMTLGEDGTLAVIDAEDHGGADHADRVMARVPIAEGVESVSAAHFDVTAGVVTLATNDGRLTQGTIETGTAPLRVELLPDDVRAMTPGERRTALDDDTRAALASVARRSGLRGDLILIWREAEGEQGWYARDLTLEFAAPVEIGVGEGPVGRIAAAAGSGRSRVATILRENEAIVAEISERRSFRGPASINVRATAIAFAEDELNPRYLLPLGGADGLMAVYYDGRAHRLLQRDDGWEVIERSSWGESIMAARMALGGRSVIVGDLEGSVRVYLPVESTTEGASDGRRFVLAHRAKLGTDAILNIQPSERERTVAVSIDGGPVVLWNTTSAKVVVRTKLAERSTVLVAPSPDLESVASVTLDRDLAIAQIDPAHPEASWSSLFGKVHYEAYDEPTYVYQAEGAIRSEPKLSLIPLVWGTLKATVVAMVIAAPLAVLAALYTSEFMHPNARRVVKPVIELMASLPSVVLGFIAAMVVAPWMRDNLPGFVTWLLAAPVAVVFCAQAWRAVPPDVSRRVRTVARLALIAVILFGATVVAAIAGPAIESALFAESGSFRLWLENTNSPAYPGWLIALLPVAALVVTLVEGRLGSRFWERFVDGEGPRAAGVGLIRSLWQLAIAASIAGLLGWMFSYVGLDTRSTIFGSGEPPNFFQRNTLVVGIVMGFAVIPIIYTISEDAMRAVPEGLRAASLGCGATPWQTATRVVLPVATSGVFSACMVGLGRAVGETMIVLMATGNTPLMEWNIFSGVRTLAANIAVELPEVARGGTHYRVLFLCGLVLFLLTLIVNTTAEIVRQRFRKRSAAL